VKKCGKLANSHITAKRPELLQFVKLL